jgi:hypothetical protein
METKFQIYAYLSGVGAYAVGKKKKPPKGACSPSKLDERERRIYNWLVENDRIPTREQLALILQRQSEMDELQFSNWVDKCLNFHNGCDPAEFIKLCKQ